MTPEQIQMFLNQRSETGLRIILNMILNRPDGKHVLQQTIEKYRTIIGEEDLSDQYRSRLPLTMEQVEQMQSSVSFPVKAHNIEY